MLREKAFCLPHAKRFGQMQEKDMVRHLGGNRDECIHLTGTNDRDPYGKQIQ